MREKNRLIFMVLSFIIIISCKNNESQTIIKNKSNLIKYKLLDPNVPHKIIELEKIFKINMYIENNQEKYFGMLVDFMVDGTSIFLINYTTSNIYQFSELGEFVRVIGRKGSGPEESIRPGPMFKIGTNYYWMSQNPPKFMIYDSKMNFKKIIETKNFYWLQRNQANKPIFFISHNVLLDENNKYMGYTRGYHSFNLYGKIADTVISVKFMKSEEIKGNVYYLKYHPKNEYIITDDGSIWQNDTYDYIIKIKHKLKEDKVISVDMDRIRLTQKAKDKLINEFESKNLNNMLARAGLKIKLENPPNYLKTIGRILLLDDKIWVVLNKAKNQRNYIIHRYKTNGELEEIILTGSNVFLEAKRIYLKSNILYAIIKDKDGFVSFTKYKFR